MEGRVILSENFRWKRTSPVIYCRYQKAVGISLSYEVKLSAEFFFSLLQSTSVADTHMYTISTANTVIAMRRAVKTEVAQLYFYCVSCVLFCLIVLWLLKHMGHK